MAKYVRKTRDEWDLKERFDGGVWRIIAIRHTFSGIKMSRRGYLEHFPYAALKITKRRVKIEPEVTVTGRTVTDPPMQALPWETDVSHG